jgi:hypothetical protein
MIHPEAKKKKTNKQTMQAFDCILNSEPDQPHQNLLSVEIYKK